METITIDKAIDVMKNYKEYTAFSQINGRIKAVEIMRKYQKIEQIFKDIEECELVEDFALDEIREVIRNGNDDKS